MRPVKYKLEPPVDGQLLALLPLIITEAAAQDHDGPGANWMRTSTVAQREKAARGLVFMHQDAIIHALIN